MVEETKRITELDKELSGERNLVRSLKLQLEKNQKLMQSAHLQNNELIEVSFHFFSFTLLSFFLSSGFILRKKKKKKKLKTKQNKMKGNAAPRRKREC